MTDPLRLSFEVGCPPAHAFEVWTARIATWWPADHTVSGEPGTDIVLEPRDGGRIFERAADGTEHDWGQVTGWEPPHRLAYRWHLRQDAADATDVQITFADAGGGSTLVEIEHTGWDRLGARGPGARDANRGGWQGLLPHFIAACAAAAAS